MLEDRQTPSGAENSASKIESGSQEWQIPDFEEIDIKLVRAANNANFDCGAGFTNLQT